MKHFFTLSLAASLVTALGVVATAPTGRLAATLATLSPGTPFADVLKAHPAAVYSDVA